MSVSGLHRPQRIIARDRTTQAAMLGLAHGSALHYTQGPERWEGITQHKVARRGQYPTHADCSSFATWCLWNGLALPFGLSDGVNGSGWAYGWTGTMAQHGRRVQHLGNVLRGDCVLYGSAPNYQHVAIVVGHRDGKPVVVSNGSENGPYLLPYDYRRDIGQIRRYI